MNCSVQRSKFDSSFRLLLNLGGGRFPLGLKIFAVSAPRREELDKPHGLAVQYEFFKVGIGQRDDVVGSATTSSSTTTTWTTATTALCTRIGRSLNAWRVRSNSCAHQLQCYSRVQRVHAHLSVKTRMTSIYTTFVQHSCYARLICSLRETKTTYMTKPDEVSDCL